MNTTLGERKCALFLATLAPRDRSRLLAALPAPSATRVAAALSQVLALPLPVPELARSLLSDDAAQATVASGLEVDQLIDLSEQLPTAWFARVLTAWTGVDRAFCVSLLETAHADAVVREMDRVAELPPRLAAAMKAEALARVSRRSAA